MDACTPRNRADGNGGDGRMVWLDMATRAAWLESREGTKDAETEKEMSHVRVT